VKKNAKHISFSGHVQGVGFRFTAHRIALNYDLTGFVRNTDDGKVELLVQGNPQNISDCLRDLCDTFGNYIKNTEIEEIPVNPKYTGFQISF